MLQYLDTLNNMAISYVIALAIALILDLSRGEME